MNYQKYMKMKNRIPIYNIYGVNLLLMVHRAYDQYIFAVNLFSYIDSQINIHFIIITRYI